jgi:hypothetical protein
VVLKLVEHYYLQVCLNVMMLIELPAIFMISVEAAVKLARQVTYIAVCCCCSTPSVIMIQTSTISSFLLNDVGH